MLSDKNKIYKVGTLVYTGSAVAVLFCWMLWGDFAWSMKERAVGSIATLMVKSFGISDLTFSLLIVSFPSFTNIFLGPIVSYVSDRHRGRYGRRIPFLLFTIPFIVIGMIGMGFSPWLGTALAGAAGEHYLTVKQAQLAVFAVFWISLDFGTTLNGALFNALVNDVVPQELLGRFFAFFRAISLGAGIFFNAILLDQVKEYSLIMCLVLGILYGAGLTSLCVKVKEGEYPENEDTDLGKGSLTGAVKKYFVECFSLPYYRWVIIAYVMCSLAAMPVNIFYLLYAESIGLSLKYVGYSLAATYIVSFVLCYWLGALADRFHPLRIAAVCMVLYGVVSLGGFWFADTPVSFIAFFIAHGIVAGMFYTGAASYNLRLFPRALFAQFNSAFFMMNALALTLLAPVLGFYLDLTGNQYKYTFLWGTLLALISIYATIKVYCYFIQYGGDANYTAPDPVVKLNLCQTSGAAKELS